VTDDPVRILRVETLLASYGRLTETEFELLRRDGRRVTLNRETYARGDAAAVLPIDPERDTVLLVRQFRLATRRPGYDGMMLEAIAGLLDGGDAAETVRREAEEEAGVRLRDIRFLFEAFMSPGAFTEKLFFYAATYGEGDRVAEGGGLEAEGEDIEVIEMPLGAALSAIKEGKIADAKTIMLLQAAHLERISKASL
jgi:nudix-type nucleoside diphosphatase (YffH/AdpP family)